MKSQLAEVEAREQSVAAEAEQANAAAKQAAAKLEEVEAELAGAAAARDEAQSKLAETAKECDEFTEENEQLAAQLPNASADQQRMLLGEALYPLVDSIEPASSAKITGMLLEMDQSEVLHLIEDSKALSDKVQEAVAVLKAAASEDA